MKNKGITLISLVITIIILIILAGVAISLSLGNNGIFMRAKQSTEQYKKSEIKEEIELAIIDIQSAIESNEIEGKFGEKAIIENLPNKIQNIIVDENLTGEYKNYEYWIDENYEVHIGERLDNPIKINIEMPYVGTSSMTIKVDATSTKGEIVKYQYKVNNEIKKETTESSYTIDNLESETKYIISVTAIDDEGNNRNSMPTTIATKQRTYIIKNGEELLKGDTYNATIDKENDYLKLIATLTIYRAGYYINCDPNNYKKAKIDCEVINKGITTSGCMIAFCTEPTWNTTFNNYISIATYNEASKERSVYSIDIKDTEIAILKNSTKPETSAIIHIYNLWLEE